MSRTNSTPPDARELRPIWRRWLPSRPQALGAVLVVAAIAPAVAWTTQGQQQQPFDEAARTLFRQAVPQRLQPLVVDLRSRSFLPSRAITPMFVNEKAELYVQFAHDLTSLERGRLIQMGVRFFDLVGPATYSVRLRRSAFDALQQSALVRGFGIVNPEDKVTAEIFRGEIRPNAVNIDGSYQMLAYFHADVRLVEALDTLDSLGILVPDRSRYRFNQKLEVAVAPHKVMTLAASHRLRMLALIPPPAQDDNVNAAALSNIDDLQVAPYNLTGTGVVYGQWESGNPLTTHSDLTGRVTVQEAGSTTDHGTHVAGTILGDGTGNASARGMSTAATLFSWTFSNFDDEHFNAVPNQGVDITNNSWGSTVGWDSGSQTGNQGLFGSYDSQAFDIDQVIEIRRVTVCKSAGNDGNDCDPADNTDCDGTLGSDGFRYDTIPTWGNAKNVITIGAQNDNGTLASFSSTGPSDDGRVKPDIVANGTGLLSSWAGGVTDNTCGMGASYCGISGTSMSSPTVAGAIGLLFERYRQVYLGSDPGPDIIKALLVNSATDVGRPGPDYRFGHGQLDALGAARLIDAGPVRIVTEAVDTNEIDTWLIAVPAGTPELRTTLCWIDWEGQANSGNPDLVNQLNLELISPTNQVFFPFSCDPANVTNNATATGPNTVDTVEHARILNPAQGFWRARVRGISVAQGAPQDYALVSNLAFQLGTQPNITVNAALDFDELCEGEFQDKVVSIFNTGGADLLVHSVAVTSGNATFSLHADPIQPFLVHAGSHVDVTVHFDPTGPGPFTGTLQIFSNDPDQMLYDVPMTGSGCPPPDIAVSGSLDFGNVCAGELAEKVINICNVGGDDLDVTSVSFLAGCDDFAIIHNIFPATVLPGHCLPLTIRYTPTEAGPHVCGLRITSNDPDEPLLILGATGDTPPVSLDVQDVPAFDPTVLVTLGDCERVAPLNITNNGTCPIYIKDVMITPPGAHFGDFVLVNRPAVPITLNPGEALGDGLLEVHFQPHQVERAIVGTLQVKYQSDNPAIGDETTITRTFCGEGVKTGGRLVVKHNGVPVPSVDRITLYKVESLGPPLLLTAIETVTNKPVIDVPATPPCPAFSFHREWGGVTNPIQLAPGNYLIEARVTVNGQQNIYKLNFTVDTCDFLPDLVMNV